MNQIADFFDDEFDKDLGEVLSDETSFNYGKALASWVTADPVKFAAVNSGEMQPDVDRIPFLRVELIETLDRIAEVDAQNIRACCEGLGSSDDRLISIITSRTRRQLIRIDRQYRLKYGMTVGEQIDDECSGNYATFLKAICEDTAKLDAKRFHKAMKGMGTDEDALSEIIGTRSNADLHHIKKAYQTLFDSPLITAIKGETSGFGEDDSYSKVRRLQHLTHRVPLAASKQLCLALDRQSF